MLINELRPKKVREPQVGDTTPHDYNPGWEDLNWLKQQAQKDGARLSTRLQLFVPRRNMAAQPARDRRMDNLANKYAWDEKDPTQLKPEYAKWELPRRDLSGTGMQDDEVKEGTHQTYLNQMPTKDMINYLRRHHQC